MFEDLKKQEPERLFRSLTDGQVFEEQIRGPHTVYVREATPTPKVLHFFKASPIGDVPVEPVTMIFDKNLDEAKFEGAPMPLEVWERDAWAEAETMAEALYHTIPQGVRYKLLIELMKREVQLFHGIDVIPRDQRLIDWLQGIVRGAEVSIYEDAGAAVLDIKQVVDHGPIEVFSKHNPEERYQIGRPPFPEVTARFRGRTVRDVLNQAATYENVSAEDVARAARDFIGSCPNGFGNLAQVVEKRYGPLRDPRSSERTEQVGIVRSCDCRSPFDLGTMRCQGCGAPGKLAEGSSVQSVVLGAATDDSKRKREPRAVLNVLNQIIAIIPDSETQLHTELSRLRKRAEFKAPEAAGDIWYSGSRILNETFPGPSALSDWQRRVVNIWMSDEPVEPSNMSLHMSLQREEQSKDDAQHGDPQPFRHYTRYRVLRADRSSIDRLAVRGPDDPPLAVGQIIYPGNDSFGCASDDTHILGLEHSAVSLSDTGTPFFTIPSEDIEQLPYDPTGAGKSIVIKE